MKDFSDLFTEEYSSQYGQWLNGLKSELKLDQTASIATKKHLGLGPWPSLSLEALKAEQLASKTVWKKAAQTYYQIDANKIIGSLAEDLEGGARVFFLCKDFLNDAIWKKMAEVFRNFVNVDEIEVYLLGDKEISTELGFKIFDENKMILGRDVHEQGGHNVHELALVTCKLIENLENCPTHVGVFMDSHFFKNIAKVRALKLLIQKVCKEAGVKNEPQVLTLNSYREWTLFERYSNILRNNVQVASGYIAGADVIQSSGYQLIFDLETDCKDVEHNERSQRMARNTSHILSLESMLGIVNDAAYGSYHLENLSHQYAEAAWKLMQVLLSYNHKEREEFLNSEIKQVRDLRLERIKLRKDVLAGINDYPDAKEKLACSLKNTGSFRVARVFEEARLKLENIKNKPKVEIQVQGEIAALNNRINFIKNYFELIGLEVMDPFHSHEKPENKILVLCAKDEDYPELAKKTANEKCFARYIAGKVHLEGHEAIHAGQDVYQVLSQLVAKLVGEK